MSTENEIKQQLFSITQQFLQESSMRRDIRLDSELDRELGIGSLEKAELFHRIEQHFGIKFPESLFISARSLIDIKNELVCILDKEKIITKKSSNIMKAHFSVNVAAATTLLDILYIYKKLDENRGYIYLQQEEERVITYGELYDQAIKVAAGLQKLKISYNDTVAIMLPTSEEFFFAFYGILLAGAIPVPIYPPMRLDQIEEYAHNEAKILQNAGIKVLISFKEAKFLNKLLRPFVSSLKHVLDVTSLINLSSTWEKPKIKGKDVALLQYTSGSTGNPKGVVLTHDNLLANIKAYGKGVQVKPNDVVVSWLPLYHDMGLIGTVMGCLYYGNPLILMSPLTFLSRPEKWLWTIHYRRATISAAPNFAYELCATKINEKDLCGLDLSSWRLALNGSEKVYAKTVNLFCQQFAKYGFQRKAFFPVYGLAECSVALTFPHLNREPVIDRIQAQVFEEEHIAVKTFENKNHYEFVSCGFPLPGHFIRIVNDEGKEVEERRVGNLQFCGPSAMQGYYRNYKSTTAVFHHGWWDTGDLAYIANQQLFITGRKKDLIIKAGRNYYPQEIEDAVNEIHGVRRGCVAAFGIFDATNGTEKVVVVAEKKKLHNNEELIAKISEAITNRIGLPPDDIALVLPKTIPKTSSGKLRRASCKQMYLDGSLFKSQQSVWLQVIKLFCQSSIKKIKKVLTQTGKLCYTIYAVSVFTILFIPTWPLVYALPQKKALKLMRQFCKVLLICIFCPVSCVGEEFFKGNKKIYVCNHTSYLDVVVLMTKLSTEVRFVGKQELTTTPVIGRLFKKLGVIFVDRKDIIKSITEIEKISREIDSGYSVLFFPEGTFSERTGVMPFKLGPFKLSVQKHIEICPVALKNVREILRANHRLMCPRRIKITASQPKMPQNQEWGGIVALRNWARKEISNHCGEETIDLVAAGIELREEE